MRSPTALIEYNQGTQGKDSGVHDTDRSVFLEPGDLGNKSDHANGDNAGDNCTDQQGTEFCFATGEYFHQQIAANYSRQHGMGDGICQERHPAQHDKAADHAADDRHQRAHDQRLDHVPVIQLKFS